MEDNELCTVLFTDSVENMLEYFSQQSIIHCLFNKKYLIFHDFVPYIN